VTELARFLGTWNVRFRRHRGQEVEMNLRQRVGMGHVEARILEMVARLFPEPFRRLVGFCEAHREIFHPAVLRFHREVQFYLAYLDFIAPLKAKGLHFCYPSLSGSKEVLGEEAFDLALADRLIESGGEVVTNSFHTSGDERILVVTGPNQGGKTTFARTFGQLHHLARLGCPVPGRRAETFLFDRILTHFERAEDVSSLTGKLEEELLRVRDMLREGGRDSIFILNEPFSSTTWADGLEIGRRVMEAIREKGALCVWVTFLDELAHAMTLVRKHRLTCHDVIRRIGS
jgi:DNA mismatch repair ATPase MutS